MVLFLSGQQALDCISLDGRILGEITFDHAKGGHIFCPGDELAVISPAEQASIDKRLSGLNTGEYTIAMQDDD